MRMGGTNKLLELIDGVPVVVRVAYAAREGGARPVVVVTGHQADAVEAALSEEPIEVARNPRWSEGMSSSIACGVAALDGRVAGALICLGDMPRVTADDVYALVTAFRDESAPPSVAPAAYVPVHRGRWGNPVLWNARWFRALRQLSGDRGAKALLKEIQSPVVEVQVGPGVLLDADTPDALRRLRGSPEEWTASSPDPFNEPERET
jgi:molybdenum cofactor cytidylyltransferase